MKKTLLLVIALLYIMPMRAMDAMDTDTTLRRMAARMLMVGFKGDTITPGNPVNGYITDLKVGAVILFDIDLTGDATPGSRNITTAPRLAALTASLNALADYPLLIAADQEGGLVQRLKPRYGFEPLPSAHSLGLLDNIDSTRAAATLCARQLNASGINVNLAPDLDIHRPDCPAIGRLDRAFADSAAVISRHAAAMAHVWHRHGIINAVKHFPGHGSATQDSHYGLTDVSRTWSPAELQPFGDLIDSGAADMVMTAHIFNGNLDPDYPATLSHCTLTGLLREKMGFDGVILTDDLYMQGIIGNYTVEDAVVLAINAGADMLMAGNNITTGFEPQRPYLLVDIICRAVRDGRIPYSRIVESNRRITALIRRLAHSSNNE